MLTCFFVNYEDISKNQIEWWQEILIWRKDFEENWQAWFEQVEVKTRAEAISRGVFVIQNIYGVVEESGLDIDKAEPVHSTGHFTRDYLHGLILVKNLELDPRHLFLSLIA